MGKALALAGVGLEDLPGNRQPGTVGWLKLKVALWETVEAYLQRGFDTFYCDVKTGTDLLCWEVLMDVRDSGVTPVQLIAARSYAERGAYLSRTERLQKALPLVEADKVVDMKNLEACCRYMADKADAALGIYHGESCCPAASLIQYAQEKQKEAAVFDTGTLEKDDRSLRSYDANGANSQ